MLMGHGRAKPPGGQEARMEEETSGAPLSFEGIAPVI